MSRIVQLRNISMRLMMTVALLGLSHEAHAALKTPSSLKAKALSSSSISLKWKDKSTDEMGFRIYRSESSSGVFALVETLSGANLTTYTATALSSSKKYSFKVQAFNAAAQTALSKAASATTAAGTTVVNPPVTPPVNPPVTPPGVVVNVGADRSTRVGEAILMAPTIRGQSIAASYEWDFGDGERWGNILFGHAYAQPGVYTAIFRVTDGGVVYSDSLVITVGPELGAPCPFAPSVDRPCRISTAEMEVEAGPDITVEVNSPLYYSGTIARWPAFQSLDCVPPFPNSSCSDWTDRDNTYAIAWGDEPAHPYAERIMSSLSGIAHRLFGPGPLPAAKHVYSQPGTYVLRLYATRRDSRGLYDEAPNGMASIVVVDETVVRVVPRTTPGPWIELQSLFPVCYENQWAVPACSYRWNHVDGIAYNDGAVMESADFGGIGFGFPENTSPGNAGINFRYNPEAFKSYASILLEYVIQLWAEPFHVKFGEENLLRVRDTLGREAVKKVLITPSQLVFAEGDLPSIVVNSGNFNVPAMPVQMEAQSDTIALSGTASDPRGIQRMGYVLNRHHFYLKFYLYGRTTSATSIETSDSYQNWSVVIPGLKLGLNSVKIYAIQNAPGLRYSGIELIIDRKQ